MTETLDHALKERLRSVLDRRTVTESVLRRLSEEGAACLLILEARLQRHERRLADVSADPLSALAEIAAEMRAVNELRPDIEELRSLLDSLDSHARELRSSWLAGGAASTPG